MFLCVFRLIFDFLTNFVWVLMFLYFCVFPNKICLLLDFACGALCKAHDHAMAHFILSFG